MIYISLSNHVRFQYVVSVDRKKKLCFPLSLTTEVLIVAGNIIWGATLHWAASQSSIGGLGRGREIIPPPTAVSRYSKQVPLIFY